MIAPMGRFNVDVTVANLNDPARHRQVSLMVDTGATYTTLPRELIEALGCSGIGSRHVMFANGREEEWPIATLRVTVDGQEGPTFCLISPGGGPALLGAVTLEELALGVDPVAQRLVPIRGYVMAVSQRVERRRRAVGPAVRHDAECLDEPLPAARERDRHPEVEELILGEVPQELAVKRGVDRRRRPRHPIRKAERHLRPLG
jgi:predicted aspartyl protease